ncbi:hypothetical protein [Bradyrhizobium sp.]|uniref:hypothetical protein n=1 Tax=Bradyrhizobium sp. TaxID=376 RepID=UPI003BB0FAC1
MQAILLFSMAQNPLAIALPPAIRRCWPANQLSTYISKFNKLHSLQLRSNEVDMLIRQPRAVPASDGLWRLFVQCKSHGSARLIEKTGTLDVVWQFAVVVTISQHDGLG